MKLRDLLVTHDILEKLSQQKMSAKLAWKFNLLLEEFNSYAKRFDTVRQDISKDVDEKEKEVELNELLDEEITFNNKLTFEDLEKIGYDFTPIEMQVLSVLVEMP